MFFAGYRIWAQRQRLVRYFWKNVSPENRTLIKTNSKRKHKSEQKNVQTKCKNPFHFLQRHLNLSRQRATKCPCSKDIYREKPVIYNDVRTFVHKFSTLSKNAPEVRPKRYIQLPLGRNVMILSVQRLTAIKYIHIATKNSYDVRLPR